MNRIEENYIELARMLKRYLLCFTFNEDLAEELTQETFYKALKRIDSFDGSCKLSTWLCQIAKNTFYDYKKKQKINTIDLDTIAQSLISKDKNPEEIFMEKQKIVELIKIINELEEPYREIVLLRAIQDLDYKEISSIVGKSENWVRVNYYRAKKQIQERSKKDEM